MDLHGISHHSSICTNTGTIRVMYSMSTLHAARNHEKPRTSNRIGMREQGKKLRLLDAVAGVAEDAVSLGEVSN